VLHPGTGQPVGPDDLAPLFPMELIGQEVSEDAEIPIPDEVLDIYALWRPTPLYRAHLRTRRPATVEPEAVHTTAGRPPRAP
jgi:tryptophan synthase beta chain